MDDINIQVKFTIAEEGYPSYTDALYISLNDYNAMDQAQLDALKQERYDNWKQAFDNPPVAETPVENPVSSVDQARQILNNALAQLDALPQDDATVIDGEVVPPSTQE